MTTGAALMGGPAAPVPTTSPTAAEMEMHVAKEFDTYVKAHPETGAEMERTPSTMREVVALEFDGWRKKKRGRSGSPAPSSGGSTAGKSGSSS